ncbi:MAG: hypothetical protein ACYSTN_01675 [Planctomycetota bacterium]|jgi:hypothetical protein
MANVRTTVVHVTHEATGKIGGIGAVLQGFFTSNAYLEAVDRSILVGPLFSSEGSQSTRKPLAKSRSSTTPESFTAGGHLSIRRQE